jgi:hypothetical protein
MTPLPVVRRGRHRVLTTLSALAPWSCGRLCRRRFTSMRALALDRTCHEAPYGSLVHAIASLTAR